MKVYIPYEHSYDGYNDSPDDTPVEGYVFATKGKCEEFCKENNDNKNAWDKKMFEGTESSRHRNFLELQALRKAGLRPGDPNATYHPKEFTPKENAEGIYYTEEIEVIE